MTRDILHARPAFPVPLPRANSLLLGHTAADVEVRRWIETNRLPHALLISGPWGIGKATFAYRIARSVLASEGRSVSADETARWIAAGTHPGLLSIERKFDEKRGRIASEIVVDDVRRIRHFLAASAVIGGWRVVVLDAADEMNRNAANALLKVLEEPGDKCLILIVAHRAAQLPATVRSRCRQLALRPLADDVLEELLFRVSPDGDPAERQTMAALAEGSIGRALLLASNEGIAAFRFFSRFFETLAARDIGELLSEIVEAGAISEEERFEVNAHVLSWWLRRIARVAVGEGPVAPSADYATDASVACRLASALTLDRWLQVWEKTQQLLAQAAAGNLDRKQALTTVLLHVQSELRSAGA